MKRANIPLCTLTKIFGKNPMNSFWRTFKTTLAFEFSFLFLLNVLRHFFLLFLFEIFILDFFVSWILKKIEVTSFLSSKLKTLNLIKDIWQQIEENKRKDYIFYIYIKKLKLNYLLVLLKKEENLSRKEESWTTNYRTIPFQMCCLKWCSTWYPLSFLAIFFRTVVITLIFNSLSL